MIVLIMSSIMVACIIWWYADLYKIIMNFSNKLLVKNKLINMCISTIINLILLMLIFAIIAV